MLRFHRHIPVPFNPSHHFVHLTKSDNTKCEQRLWRPPNPNPVTKSLRPGRTSVRPYNAAKRTATVSPLLIPHCRVPRFEGRPEAGQNRILSWTLRFLYESDPTLSMPALWGQRFDANEFIPSLNRMSFACLFALPRKQLEERKAQHSRS